MKKAIVLLLAAVICTGLTACNTGNTEISQETVSQTETVVEEDTSDTNDTITNDSESKILIAYFSLPENADTSGVDAVAGASIVLDNEKVLGNTEYMAYAIQEAVDGDLFRIETVQQYPLEHEPLVEMADEEQNSNARPELLNRVENMEQYDTIFLGYPNWWGDMPMPLYTFLEEYDLSGKTIIPFSSHGGSGFSRTESTIAQMQPNASVSENGLTVSRNDVADSYEDVFQWAENIIAE
nr:flavodoxin [uncultured Anaerotignum sp.]